MNNTTRNILAVVIGIVVGGLVNMGLVTMGPAIDLPAGVGTGMTDIEVLKESMKYFEPKHFVFPFLAHALGTLVGAFVAARIAVSRKMACALIIGFLYLAGGVSMVYMVGGPMWFIAVDLLLAYIPMAYIGGLLAGAQRNK